MRLSALLALVLVLVPVGASAQGSSADDDLAAVRELVLHATYREALTRAQTFLARTDLDARHRNAGLEVLAIVQLVLHDAGAQATLSQLYSRDPGHRLDDPDASPVVQSAFARARESAHASGATIDDATVAAPSVRGVPTVSLSVGGADAVQELRVYYRQSGETRYASAVVSAEADGHATTPLAVSAPSGSYVVEYYVEALAPSSTVIGRLGSADAPRQLTMPAAVETPDVGVATGPVDATPASGGGIETEAWFWIVLGVVVVGAGVGTGVGVALSSQGGPQNGSLDTITLPLVAF